MLNRLVSTTAARLLALAMLLTVAVHAVQPTGAAFEVRHGSAFSADTADVALTPVRRGAPDRNDAAVAPVIPAEAAEIVPARTALPREPRLRPDPTGPPPILPLDRGPSPRAPPLA